MKEIGRVRKGTKKNQSKNFRPGAPGAEKEGRWTSSQELSSNDILSRQVKRIHLYVRVVIYYLYLIYG